VRYPARIEEDRISLYTSLDWDQRLEPVTIDDAWTTWVFDLGQQPAPVHFKAVRTRAGASTWMAGSNKVAWPGRRDVYPHFDGGERGQLTDRFQLGERTLRVYLPAGYGENTLKRYPTLYMHDGSNLFLPEEAFTGVEWKIDQALDILDAMNLADKVVVVALYANPSRREIEYTEPGWEAYAEELVGTIKPAIDGRYRTREGPSSTAVMGSSLGGVVSLYLAWSRPEVFGMCACTSSSFGLRDQLLARVCAEKPPPIRVWLDSGWPGDNFEATREIRDALLAGGMMPGRDVLHLAFPGAEHHERSWAERAPLPLQFLFGDGFRPR
jgi:predicted alpha/beta superfamily hydrolase